MMYWNHGGPGWVGRLVMILSMIAFWGLLAWVAVAFVRATGKGPGRGHQSLPRSCWPSASLAVRSTKTTTCTVARSFANSDPAPVDPVRSH